MISFDLMAQFGIIGEVSLIKRGVIPLNISPHRILAKHNALLALLHILFADTLQTPLHPFYCLVVDAQDEVNGTLGHSKEKEQKYACLDLK